MIHDLVKNIKNIETRPQKCVHMTCLTKDVTQNVIGHSLHDPQKKKHMPSTKVGLLLLQLGPHHLSPPF